METEKVTTSPAFKTADESAVTDTDKMEAYRGVEWPDEMAVSVAASLMSPAGLIPIEVVPTTRESIALVSAPMVTVRMELELDQTAVECDPRCPDERVNKLLSSALVTDAGFATEPPSVLASKVKMIWSPALKVSEPSATAATTLTRAGGDVKVPWRISESDDAGNELAGSLRSWAELTVMSVVPGAKLRPDTSVTEMVSVSSVEAVVDHTPLYAVPKLDPPGRVKRLSMKVWSTADELAPARLVAESKRNTIESPLL